MAWPQGSRTQDPERTSAERVRTLLGGAPRQELEARQDDEGQSWQTHSGAPAVGVDARGCGPGDSFSLPYFAVSDVAKPLERVEEPRLESASPSPARLSCVSSGPYLIALTVHAQERALSLGRTASDIADAVRLAHDRRRRNPGEADWLTTARGLEIAYNWPADDDPTTAVVVTVWHAR